jgi:hypothetical protein
VIYYYLLFFKKKFRADHQKIIKSKKKLRNFNLKKKIKIGLNCIKKRIFIFPKNKITSWI